MIPNRFSLAVLLVAALAAPLNGQEAEGREDPRPAMARLAHWVGTWEGEGRFQVGPGQIETVFQRERIESALDGTLLLIEGKGTDAPDGGGQVVHHALGVVEYDPAREGYRINSWLADGRSVDAAAELTDGGLSWGFEFPGGRIRYRSANDGETWTEIGERSVDGETWTQFFEMTLHPTGDAETEAVGSR